MSKARGIVLESNKGYSTILMEGGQYIKIRRTLEVGQIYQQEGQYQKILIAVAAVLVFMLLGAVDFFNVVAYANVSNGIEMGVNRWNRVIKIEQTETVTPPSTEYSALRGQKLEEAVSIVVKDALKDKENGQDISIQVNSQKKDDSKREKKLLERIETSVEEEFSIPDKGKVAAEGKNKNSIKIKSKNAQQQGNNTGSNNNQSRPDSKKNKANNQSKPDNEQNKINNQNKPDNERNKANYKNKPDKNKIKPTIKTIQKPSNNNQNNSIKGGERD